MENIEQDHISRRRRKRLVRKGKLVKVQKRKKRRKTRRIKRRKMIKRTVGAALLAPLLPFKRPMKRALAKKGVSTKKMKFRTVVSKFYNEFVSKKGNKKSSYDPIDETDFYNDVSFVTPSGELDLNSEENRDHLALTTATIATVVKGVINLFKKAKEIRKKAKDSGLSYKEAKELIPEQDLEFGKDASQVEAKLVAKSKEDKPVTKAQTKKYITYGIVLFVLGAVVYFLSKKR